MFHLLSSLQGYVQTPSQPFPSFPFPTYKHTDATFIVVSNADTCKQIGKAAKWP